MTAVFLFHAQKKIRLFPQTDLKLKFTHTPQIQRPRRQIQQW